MISSVSILLILVLFGVAVPQECSNCLYEQEHCFVYSDTHQCMFGCKPGWVGDDCTQRCSDSRCEECRQVTPTSQECTRCREGYYGPQCNLRCSDNCHGLSNLTTCDFYGNCIYGCKEPWYGPTCSQQNCTIQYCTECRMAAVGYMYCYRCEEGLYWDNNHKVCKQLSAHCSPSCNPLTGDCESCAPGWVGSKCDLPCHLTNCLNCTEKNGNVKCAVCELGMYPKNGTCVSCVDQNCFGHCNQSVGDCPYGCQPGWYGKYFKCNLHCDIPNCNQCSLSFYSDEICLKCNPGFFVSSYKCLRCPVNCKDGLCSDHNSDCKECINGYYGKDCPWRCSDGCLGNVCNITGECECKEDWYGPYCNRRCPSYCTVESCNNYNQTLGCVECEPGRYGFNCQSKCHDNCQTVTTQNTRFKYCVKDSGECRDGCVTGFYGGNCSIPCSYGCDGPCFRWSGDCESGCKMYTYGKKCDLPCPSNCKRPLAGYERACDMKTGDCENGCTVGFTGPFCNETCAKNCRDNTCDQNGDCVYGCKDGYTGKNCDLICKGHCGNDCNPNCLNSICHPETKLCTAGCSLGWWGESCEISCRAECNEGKCSQQDGTCLGPCLAGYYGTKCDLRCSPYCINKACAKSSGSCLEGCSDRTIYGLLCLDRCSLGCLNQSCDQRTGTCLRCLAGRQGSLCEQDCLRGNYGESCEEQCGYCKDSNPCNIMDGTCPAGAGCEVGWTGPQCKESLRGTATAQGGSMSVSIGVGVGVTLAVVVVGIVIAFFMWRRRTGKTRGHHSREHVVVYKDSNASIEPVATGCSTGLGSVAMDNDSSRSDTLLLGGETSFIKADLDSCFHDNGFFKLYKGQTTMKAGKKVCCVKIHNLDDTRLDSKDHWTRLMNECELQRMSCAHTNIVQLFTTYQNKNWFSIALESCMSNNLHNYLLTSPQPELSSQEKSCMFRLLQYCVDVTSAVSHLRQLKILHRQIEASHVYLTAKNVAKLGDFYWAIVVTDNNFELENYVLESRYALHSPETLTNNQYTFQSDVWSLGLLFWEVLSLGKMPYEGLNPETHRRTVLERERPSRPRLAHINLYRLMKSCWRYSPTDRPDVENILKQLIDIQHHSVSAAAAPDRPLRSGSSEDQGYTSPSSKLGTRSKGPLHPSRPISNAENHPRNQQIGSQTENHPRHQQAGVKMENKAGNHLTGSHLENITTNQPTGSHTENHPKTQHAGSHLNNTGKGNQKAVSCTENHQRNHLAGSSLEKIPRNKQSGSKTGNQSTGSHMKHMTRNRQTGSHLENMK